MNINIDDLILKKMSIPPKSIIQYNNYNQLEFDKNFTILNKTIPKRIYLCYKTKNIPDYILPNWLKLNPDYEIKLYDNTDCIQFLKEYYNQHHVDIFNYILDGPIKADFWRVCILYKMGGIYCDIDIEPLISFNKFVDSDIILLTATSINKNELNPQIIITPTNNPILEKCINTYLDYFNKNKPYQYWDWSIVHIMTKICNKIFNSYITEDGIYYDSNSNKYQFIKEIGLTNRLSDIYCNYKNIRVLNNRYITYDSYNHTFH